MNDIATAGGTNQYYPATDTASFVSTLETITQKVASCEFELSFDDLPISASRDPALVNIYCKGSAEEEPGQSNVIRLDEGCANGHGWDWVDSNTLRLCDKACAKVRDGGCAVVSSTFGCQSVPI
jgi:hypothetical protein